MGLKVVAIAAGIVLALVGAGAAIASVVTVHDQPGQTQPIEPVIATPDPTLADPTPNPSVQPTTAPTPDPIQPAPPQDVDDDDDHDDDDDDLDDLDNG